jgi:hypothetical protein
MANTKGKIIIVSGIVVIAGITSAIIFSHYRKKRVLNEIYDAINDVKSEEGQQALLNEENQLLGSNSFDPNFYKGTKSGAKPDKNLLVPTKIARDIAKKIYFKIGGGLIGDVRRGSGFGTDDEKGIISEFKKLKSKGQVSQVASAYQNSPLNYGDLSRDVTEALTGWTDEDTYITQLTTFINNLPN